MPPRSIEIYAPDAVSVAVGTADGLIEATRGSGSGGATAVDAQWVAEVGLDEGDHYWLVVDGGTPLLDPSCWAVVDTLTGPRSVYRDPWRRSAQGAPLRSAPIVYEMHVRGFGRTFAGCIDRLDHIAGLGANVVELLPIHPFDNSNNYWGYMPLVWGAVHGGYASDPVRAAEELAEFVSAAHERGLHVWIDVVFNHTGEGSAEMPARTLRGLDDSNAYRHNRDGSYTNDSGCGNDVNPANPYVRRLILEALNRYADLGVDGFRFDLASLLTRDDGSLIAQITEWGRARGVTLVAEPWDMASYQVGDPIWSVDWLQWNDRFRDDVRGFLRGEPGLVKVVRDRVQGSPDLFANASRTSLNFVTAHDGLTMHDLTTVTSEKDRSWDCGDELRLQQLQNYFAVLLLSAGTPMWVMGDEFGRTQHGDDNPYNVDGPVSWVDWEHVGDWAALTDFVRRLVRLRNAHPPHEFTFFGASGTVDESEQSRSIAWHSNNLYVMINAWWEPLTFHVQQRGPWELALATASPAARTGDKVTLVPRSIVVLER